MKIRALSYPTRLPWLFVLLFGAALHILPTGCLKDSCTKTVTLLEYDPIYRPFADFRKPIEATAPREIVNAGRIYLYENFLLVNEVGQGIHVFDNTNSAQPIAISFLEIEGNSDFSILDGKLFANHLTDLISLDISNWKAPITLHRSELAFASRYMTDPEKGIIIDYHTKEVKKEVDCLWNGDNYWLGCGDQNFVGNTSIGFLAPNSSAPQVGVAGSTATFAIAEGHLYCLENNNLITFSLQQGQPTMVDAQYILWTAETLFPWKKRLFIGHMQGMEAYSLTNPAKPVKECQFSHATACDPIVCDDEFAYLTLSTGPVCGPATPQMDVLDLRRFPVVNRIASIPMNNPKGLAFSGNWLYVCDGGLRIMDRSNPESPLEVAFVSFTSAIKDIILVPNKPVAIVISPTEITQLDISNPANPLIISTL